MERNTRILLLAAAVSIAVPAVLTFAIAAASTDAFEVMAQALLLFTMVPLIVMSLYMWATGRGAMLIAGYNTSPRSVRDAYDAPALARFTGKLLTVSLSLMLVAMESIFLAGSMLLFGALLFASLAIIAAGIYYMNTGRRFMKEGLAFNEPLVSDRDRRRNRIIVLAVLALTAVILIAVFGSMGPEEVNATLDEDSLRVTAPMVNEDILLEDVTSVELREDFDAGHRVGGYGGIDVHSGNFRNDELGRYELAAYKAVPAHIMVHHSEGILVFNLDTAERTHQFYDALQQRL